jgi:hypothetical protein
MLMGLLGAALVACDEGAALSPTLVASTQAPDPPAPTPGATPAGPASPTPPAPSAPPTASAAPATAPAPTPTDSVPTLTAAPPAGLATPDAGALAAAPTQITPPGRIGGLLYLTGGSLAFYDPTADEQRVLVEAQSDTTKAQRVVAFAVAPDQGRLVYLFAEARVVNGVCAATSSLWALEMGNGGVRRQLAADVLPTACDDAGRAGVVAQGLAFAPDSRRLAYVAAQGASGTVGLWVVDADPRGQDTPRPLAVPETGLLISPRWAPDGSALAFLDAADLGQNGLYDANVAVLKIDGSGAPGQPAVVATGHALPGGAQAMPPFDLTWLDSRTLAFQAWNPASGPDSVWAVDVGSAGAAPRRLSGNQAGLGAWGPAGVGPRLFAYRRAGVGLFVAGSGGDALLAPADEAGGAGAVPPIWSAGGEAVAFSDRAGRLLMADRAEPGPPAAAPLPQALHAAWSATPGEAPILAAIASDARTLALYDRRGAQLASASPQGVAGSPQEIVWEPTTPDDAARRLAVRYAGGAGSGARFALFRFDPAGRALRQLPGQAIDDGSPLVWARLGSPAP